MPAISTYVGLIRIATTFPGKWLIIVILPPRLARVSIGNHTFYFLLAPFLFSVVVFMIPFNHATGMCVLLPQSVQICSSFYL